MKNTNHCVFYHGDLKYEGRICAIIRSLANSFPSHNIYLYELKVTNDYYKGLLPKNVIIKKPRLFLHKFKKSPITTPLLFFEFAIRALLFLLSKKPISVQVHNEMVTLGPLAYKYLFPGCQYVYDDKELYLPKDGNIFKSLYCIEQQLIKKSDLVIITNNYRKKALLKLHHYKLKYLIVDNYVFQNGAKALSDSHRTKIEFFKNQKKKILIHQSVLKKDRGLDNFKELISQLPDNWILGFIGIKNEAFSELLQNIGVSHRDKLHNFGYIDYNELDSFYNYIDGAVIFYNANTFNNKYCAPNRLYSAANNGVPIIVNHDNFTLSNFIQKHQNGVVFNRESLSRFFNDYESFKNNSEKLKGKYCFKESIPDIQDYYSRMNN